MDFSAGDTRADVAEQSARLLLAVDSGPLQQFHDAASNASNLNANDPKSGQQVSGSEVSGQSFCKTPGCCPQCIV